MVTRKEITAVNYESKEFSVEVIDYGNGVYYIEVPSNWLGSKMEVFGIVLSKFKTDYPELMITAMAADDSGGYGWTKGYWVSCEKR